MTAGGRLVLAAWAEACRGPGWRNDVWWVAVEDSATGKIDVVALQSDEWAGSPVLAALFGTSAALTEEARGAAQAALDARAEGAR